MRKIIMFGVLFMVFVVVLSLWGCRRKATIDEKVYLEIENLVLPVAPWARNLEKINSHGDPRNTISYDVKVIFASTEVLVFYDKEMAKWGFAPFNPVSETPLKREWQIFQDGTRSGEPETAQLLSYWTDGEKKKMAVLSMKYYWEVDRSKGKITLGYNDELHVNFQVMPFVLFPNKNL